MTTPRRRLRHLDQATCWERLAAAPTARLAYVLDGRPQIVPVNPSVQGEALYVRTMRGSRLSRLLQGAEMPVSIETDGLDPETREGWSVVLHGRLVPILDTVAVAQIDRAAEDPWILDAREAYWAQVEIDEIGGRELVG